MVEKDNNRAGVKGHAGGIAPITAAVKWAVVIAGIKQTGLQTATIARADTKEIIYKGAIDNAPRVGLPIETAVEYLNEDGTPSAFWIFVTE